MAESPGETRVRYGPYDPPHVRPLPLGLGANPEANWPQLGASIAVGVALYVPTVVVAVAAISGAVYVLCGVAAGEPLTALASIFPMFALIIAAPTLFAIAFMWVGVVAFAVVPVAAWAAHFAGFRSTDAPAAVATGASLAIAAGAVGWTHMLPISFSWPFLLFFAGGILAGEAAGARHALRDLRRRRRGCVSRRGRFGIAAMLSATALVSAILALLKLTGLLRPEPLLGLLAAATVATLGYAPTLWLINRWADRRLRKRRAARLAERST